MRILCCWLEENRKFDLTLTHSDFHVVFMEISLFVCSIHSFWWNAYWLIFFNGYCFEYMISTLWELLWLNLHKIIKESPLKSTVTVQEFFKEILEQELDTTAWNSVDTLPFSKPCKPFHQYKPHSLNNDLQATIKVKETEHSKESGANPSWSVIEKQRNSWTTWSTWAKIHTFMANNCSFSYV